MMKKINLTLFFILFAGAVLSACQPIPAEEVPTVGEPSVGVDFSYGEEATVESLNILLMESFPVQVRVLVNGYLPDGCTELEEISVETQGQDFILTLTTRRQTGDVMCTMALEFFEEQVDLDVEGLKAGTYTVIAQDQQAQFKLDVDNLLMDEPVALAPRSGEGVPSSDAVVEKISVLVMESYPVQVSVVLTGYLPDGCTSIQEVRSSRSGNTFTLQVLTQRPIDMMCTMAIVPFEQRVALDVEGLPAGRYTVRVGTLTESFTLDMNN